MVFELTVAVMPLRKLSKLIFASDMKSTLSGEKKLKQRKHTVTSEMCTSVFLSGTVC